MKTHHTAKSLWGNLILLVASVIWGFAFVFQKDAGRHLDPFSINMFRFFIGGVVLIPCVHAFDAAKQSGRRLFSFKNPRFVGINRWELIGGSLCGTFLCLASNLQQFCLSTTSPGKTAFLTALYTVFVPLFGLFLGKKAGSHIWLSVAVAAGGAYLLTMFGEAANGSPLTDGVLLLCSVVFAIHIIIIDTFSEKVDGIRFSVIQFFVAGALSLPFSLLFGNLNGGAIMEALPSLLFLGIFSCGVGYTFQIIGQQMSAQPTTASLILSLESAFGVLGGYLFGMEPAMSPAQIVGCVLILLGVVVSQMTPKKHMASKENAD